MASVISEVSARCARRIQFTLRDECAEVGIRRFPVACLGRDDVDAPLESVLVADRHHQAAGERRRESVALLLHVEYAARFAPQARRVVRFGKAHRAYPCRLGALLVQAPGFGEVPPLGAVEGELQPRLAHGVDLVQARAEDLAEELHAGALAPGGGDEFAPQLGRHLVGRVAAEALEAHLHAAFDQPDPVAPQIVPIRRMCVVDLGEIAPHGDIARVGRIDRRRAQDLAARVARKPLRMIAGEQRIARGVVEHQVHDRAHALRRVCRRACRAERRVRRRRGSCPRSACPGGRRAEVADRPVHSP